MTKADVLFMNGTVVDGTGGLVREASVAVSNSRIVDVEDVSPTRAERVIDASGLVINSGFINMHTHSDVNVVLDDACQSKVLQRVTPEVTGNCSFSPFPIEPTKLDLHEDHLHHNRGRDPAPDLDRPGRLRRGR